MKFLSRWPGAKRHLIALILAWGVFSILLGLLATLDFLESSADTQVLHGILDGLTVVISGLMVGLFLFMVPIFLLNKIHQDE